MKLNDVRPSIETSGELEEQFFSIQDQGMIFDILRNKMYSNPILAICREISCNARDAHREVGAPDVPVQITLPNNLEAFYKVRDFGPGISPDRMSNIFIKYTASTKRDDNTQTGGFGLGAKTPFSYSDTFTIKTMYNGIEYNYACFIDETKVGKLALLSQEPTTEKNGTEIIIPVKSNDFRSFSQWTEHSTRHWTVKPVIKGGIITWQENKKMLEGLNWEVVSNPNSYGRNAKLIIDGIEYPLDLSTLKTYADATLIDSIRGDLYLHFGVGELSLSASREQVYLDKATQAKINLKLDEVINDIKQKALAKIDGFSNLWEANIYYRTGLTQTFNNLKFLDKSGKLKWKGIELHTDYVSVGCSVLTFVKGKFTRRNGSDPNKLTRSMGGSIHFDESSALFINDLSIKAPTPRHVKKAFDDNLALKSLQVICPNDKITIDSLNKDIHLDKMNPSALSTITKASARSYTAPTSRLLIFKFDPKASAFRQVSYASIEEDTNEKVLCMLDRDSVDNMRQVILKNKNILGATPLYSLHSKFPKISFYGVDKDIADARIKEELFDFEVVDDFLKSKITDNKAIDYVEIKLADKCLKFTDERSSKIFSKIKSQICNSTSLFIKHGELHLKIRKIMANDFGLLNIYESINGSISTAELKVFTKDNPEFDVEKINKEYEEKYPLLRFLNTWDYNNIADHMAQYINLIDKV